jgi:hypothetical protein
MIDLVGFAATFAQMTQRDVLSRCNRGAEDDEVRRAKHFVTGLEWDVRAVERMIEAAPCSIR